MNQKEIEKVIAALKKRFLGATITVTPVSGSYYTDGFGIKHFEDVTKAVVSIKKEDSYQISFAVYDLLDFYRIP